MKAPYRTKFDPNQDFQARRRLTVSGRSFDPGEPFDKGLVDARRLRLLFDQKSIVYRLPGTTTPGAVLSPEEAAQTRRAQHSERAAKNIERFRKLAAARGAAKRKAKGDPRETHLQRRQKASETFSDPEAIRKARRKVKIPPDWRTMLWPQRLQLAASLTDEKVRNGKDAEKSILAELDRRARHA